jgi:hypothetical protein
MHAKLTSVPGLPHDTLDILKGPSSALQCSTALHSNVACTLGPSSMAGGCFHHHTVAMFLPLASILTAAAVSRHTWCLYQPGAEHLYAGVGVSKSHAFCIM